MTISDIAAFQDAGLNAPPPASRSRTELGQEDFLTLMITQFKNQDPFEPMSNGDFLGQLAQFSTVNGIESLNTGFAGLAESLQSDQLLQAASLVGRSVLAGMGAVSVESGDKVKGAVELDASASQVEIEITSAAGELVRRIDLGQQNAGLVRFTWDGRDGERDDVPDGQYFITARVTRGGRVESAEALIEAQIESVSLGSVGQGMSLNLEGGDTLSVGQVRRII